VFVPNQGIFPPYAAGMKQMDNTTVVISRGIGNSGFPLRLFNRPEIVIIEFE
jgi:predicted MPP superfamily phosphohydrolase